MTAAFCSTAFVKGTAAGRFRLAPNPGFIRDCSMPLMPEKPFPVTSRWLILWSGVLLVVLAVVAYHNSFSAPFNFDDESSIINNATIRTFWPIWNVLSPPATAGVGGRPLVNLTLALNYAWGGVDHVWGYHAVNLAIHIGAGLVLWGLVRRTLLRPALGRRFNAAAPSLALAIAVLWVVHPLQTESVTYLSQRTEALMGLFYLLTLYGFARNAEAARPGPWQVFSVAACLLGVLSKEVIVTAPAMVLLYDRTFVAKASSAAWHARRGYYLALAATWLLLLALLARAGGARGASAGFGLGVSWWNYLLTQCDALTLYLKLAVCPHPLVLDYGTAVAQSLAEVWRQGLIVLALLATTVWALVRKPVLGFAGAWFFVILAPSSSFVPLVTQTIAEHRMYLPLAAVLAAVASAAHRWLGSRPALALLAFVALACGSATIARNRDYASALVLWQDNVAHRPHARVLTALGVELVHAGRAREALPLFERALVLDPTHLSAQRNRALALLQLGRADEAAAIFAALPAREPGEAEEYFAMGNAFAREQKFPEAAAAYTRTLTLVPDHAAAHADLGNIRLLQGRVREAIAEYETVLRLHPDDARARENLQLARESLR